MWTMMDRYSYSHMLLNLDQKSFFGLSFGNSHQNFKFTSLRSSSSSRIYVHMHSMVYIEGLQTCWKPLSVQSGGDWLNVMQLHIWHWKETLKNNTYTLITLLYKKYWWVYVHKHFQSCRNIGNNLEKWDSGKHDEIDKGKLRTICCRPSYIL